MKAYTLIHNGVRILALLTAMLIGLLLARVHGAELDPVALRATEIQFDYHWERYLLAELGCPTLTGTTVVKGLTADDCKEQPLLLADEKKKARELAKKVFGLVEPDANSRR
jgi:hypothetical protein